jgi:diguanylate cyclase (GGDEF)-like protein
VNRRSAPRRLTPVPPWPASGTLDAHIRAEQVRVVFQQGPPAQLLSIAAGGVVCYALWDVGNRTHLLTWLILLTAVTLVRIGLAVAFQRGTPTADAMSKWEWAFVISLTAASLVWGVGGWLVMPESTVHRAIIYFFLMGVAGGAVSSYSAHPAATAVSILSLMLPATLVFAFQPSLELRAMAAGGALYLLAALRSTRTFGYFLARNFQLSFELHEAYERAKDLSRTDELTGLPNRRAFVEQGAGAIELARRHSRPLSLVMFDIDHFKAINDTHGHAAGDAVLREVASAIWHVARTSDLPGRLGGEEFGVLLPETSGTDGVTVAERLREEIGRRTVTFAEAGITPSCSFGVAERGTALPDLDALMRAADQALYQAKADGRNRVQRHG